MNFYHGNLHQFLQSGPPASRGEQQLGDEGGKILLLLGAAFTLLLVTGQFREKGNSDQFCVHDQIKRSRILKNEDKFLWSRTRTDQIHGSNPRSRMGEGSRDPECVPETLVLRSLEFIWVG
eukprot:6234051-Amphidinium_carterae.3